MPDAPLAQRLLDAQVAWVVHELTAPEAQERLTGDLDAIVASSLATTFADLDAAALKRAARAALATLSASPLGGSAAVAAADALYDFADAEHYLLEQFVARDTVDALVVTLLGLRQLHDHALDRLSDSPLVAQISTRFVTKLVTDFVNQNRARAERMPGLGSMIKLGTSAAGRMISPFDSIIGDAADKGAQTALRRTTMIVKELIDQAPLHEAIMQIWDLHAVEPLSELRAYLTRDELDEVIARVTAILASAADSEVAGASVDAVVDAVLAAFADRTPAGVLAELGVTPPRVSEAIAAGVQWLLGVAVSGAALEQEVRARLAPFFASDEVAALLAE